jgi:hypothetical protein
MTLDLFPKDNDERWRSATAAAYLESVAPRASGLRICCAEPLRSSARSPWTGSS